MRMIKASALLVSAALAVSAVGAPIAVAQDDAEKTEITWLYLSDWTTSLEAAMAEFAAQNPDIDVVMEGYGFGELFEQIQIRMSSGDTTPDVITVDSPRNSSYALRGWLEPLDGLYTQEEVDDWAAQPLASATYDGQLTSGPWSNSTQLFYYNKPLLDAAGIPYPGEDERWTWEQVADAALKVKEAVPEATGFNWEQMVQIYQLQPLACSLGGAPLSEDGLAAEGIVNSQEWVDAMTYYWKIYNEWEVAPQGEVLWTPDGFETGDVAMMVAGPWNLGRFINSEVLAAEDWGVSRHPFFEGGEVCVPTGAWNIGLNPNSEKMDAAKRLIHFLTTAEGIDLWWKGPGDPPASKTVMAQIDTDPAYDEWPQSAFKVMAAEAVVAPVLRPVSVAYLEYEAIFSDAFQDIRNGADPKEALDLAAERMDREFAKYSQ